MTDPSEEAFEAWASTKGVRDFETPGMWLAWTAAVAWATQRERERCAKVCDEIALAHNTHAESLERSRIHGTDEAARRDRLRAGKATQIAAALRAATEGKE